MLMRSDHRSHVSSYVEHTMCPTTVERERQDFMLSDDRRTLARRIFDTAHLTGQFRLRSGVVSNEYFDKYLFEADPLLLRDIATAMCALILSWLHVPSAQFSRRSIAG